jgi:hypothetical protein
MTKTLKSKEEFYIDFSDEELAELDIQKGDKFSVKPTENGLFLEKYATLEIDLDAWSKEDLMNLIVRSMDNDQTIEETIEEILTEVVAEFKD